MKCVACGRKGQIVLHGTSYCTRCGVKGLNKPSIKMQPTSPLERVIQADIKTAHPQLRVTGRRPGYSPGGWAWDFNHRLEAQMRVKPKNRLRNKRRRGLQAKRLASPYQFR